LDGKKAKIAVSMALALIGASLAVLVTPDAASARSADGIIIDFGDRDIDYVPIDVSVYPDAVSALERACAEQGYDLVMDGSHPVAINSSASDGERSWGLFVTKAGELQWTRAEDPSEVRILDYSAVAWGYCPD